MEIFFEVMDQVQEIVDDKNLIQEKIKKLN